MSTETIKITSQDINEAAGTLAYERYGYYGYYGQLYGVDKKNYDNYYELLCDLIEEGEEFDEDDYLECLKQVMLERYDNISQIIAENPWTGGRFELDGDAVARILGNLQDYNWPDTAEFQRAVGCAESKLGWLKSAAWYLGPEKFGKLTSRFFHDSLTLSSHRD